MNLALAEARLALETGDVPVGALVVSAGQVVGRGRNGREARGDPLAHAEMIALAQAARTLGRWRLSDCTLYVTLEPCPMCAGAILQCRLGHLVFGASDSRAGCCGTLYDLLADGRFPVRVTCRRGLMAQEAAGLLSGFFRSRRRARKAEKGPEPPSCP
ncbi:MAG: nucleoside deaminase [Synergistales bacterium]|nr:nucleoside deaminase [Synergistales bacterium]